MAQAAADMTSFVPLPRLRLDLEVFPGPPARDGSPTFTLYDPLNRAFHKLGWAEMTIIDRLRKPCTLKALSQYLRDKTTLRVSDEELELICRQASAAGLTMDRNTQPVQDLLEADRRRRVNPFRKMFQSYVYVRIPLLRPDDFLGRTVHLFRWLASKWAFRAYALVWLVGLVLLLPRWETYLHTFTYFFNLQGVVAYSLAIILVKAIHEFSHAYVAKSMGAHVPVMGVALILLWPVAFSDVTDSWRLASRRKRLAITVAGVAAEMTLAGFALLLWGLCPPGPWQSVFFLLSSGSLLSTLLINLNPAMRFDGYFLLMDLWGVDNLQTRAFALTRWAWRKYLLGIDAPPPEHASPRRLAAMTVYSIYCWNYRLFLYLGIALLIYSQFTKALGSILFFAAIWWFLGKPILAEVFQVARMRKALRFNFRLTSFLVILLGVVLWLVLPLSRSISVPAYVVPAESQIIYTPQAGVLQSLEVRRGEHVQKGQLLARITSRAARSELVVLRGEEHKLLLQLEVLSVDSDDRARLPEKERELSRVRTQISQLEKKIDQGNLRADLTGKIYELDQDLRPGMHLMADEALGKICTEGDARIYAFADEQHVGEIQAGDEAGFMSSDASGILPGVVTKVNPVRQETIEHAGLTSMTKGDLPVVRDDQGRLAVLESIYLVEVNLNTPVNDLRPGQSGKVWLQSRPRSLLMDGLSRAYKVLLRESSY